MKASVHLIIFFLTSQTSWSPTLGFDFETLYGRSYFALLPFRRDMEAKFVSLSQKASSLASQVSLLSNQNAVLSNQVSTLNGQLSVLQAAPVNNQGSALGSQVAALATQVSSLNGQVLTQNSQLAALQAGPACPANAPIGSKVIGSYCYFVTTTPDTFLNARLACGSRGGILAAPSPANSPTFYNSINSAFPAATATIGPTGQIWIGLLQTITIPGNPFAYISNNALVLPTNTIFTGLPTASNTIAAVLTSPGTSWTGLNSAVASNTKAYICQYDTA